MFGHERLDEDGRLIRIEPGGQPVGDYRHRIFVDLRRVRVIAGERVPIGDEMVALVNVLQLDPVFKRALVIAEVQTTRGRIPLTILFIWVMALMRRRGISTAS